MDAAIRQLLKDPEAMWESLSVDGVEYNFDKPRSGDANYLEQTEKMFIFDNERAIAIGNFIELHESGTVEEKIAFDAAIGSIIRRQVLAHLASINEFNRGNI